MNAELESLHSIALGAVTYYTERIMANEKGSAQQWLYWVDEAGELLYRISEREMRRIWRRRRV